MTDTGQPTRSIFISGAASGIGLETARLFVKQGWRVALCDRDAVGIATLSEELGDNAYSFPVDVLDSAGLARAMEKFCATSGGQLDVLFNSAGILDMRRFDETPLERLHAVLDVNIKGAINAVHTALPYLKRARDARVITMSSVAAVYGVPDEAAYSASKFAVRGLTEALNIELEQQDIWVCDLMVAYVQTPMLTAASHVATSVNVLGIHVLPTMVAAKVLEAVGGRQVHWFVTDADAQISAQVGAMTADERRAMMA